MSGTSTGGAKISIDLTGRRFGRWTALSRDGSRWLCRCDCGTKRFVNSGNLRGGATNSCGCLNRELIKARGLRHGHGRGRNGNRVTPEYTAWANMRTRCTNPKFKAWAYYGGRGIRVTPEWLGPGGFERFLAHIGQRPSPRHSVDRINTNGNYEPGNVRWATPEQQASNRRPYKVTNQRNARGQFMGRDA